MIWGHAILYVYMTEGESQRGKKEKEKRKRQKVREQMKVFKYGKFFNTPFYSLSE